MITEDYVSFETAKLLKEKGFPQSTFRCHYIIDGNSHYKKFENRCGFGDYDIIAPTLAVAMKWMREVHGLFISIGNDDLDYGWQIFDIKNRTKDLDPTCLTDSYAAYIKYEAACEAAIKYCLENLI